MRIDKRSFSTVAVVAFLAVLGLSTSCDRDCPTQPPPPPPPVDNGTNFYVLFRDAGFVTSQAAIYVYNSKALAAVDSFIFGASADYRDIAITADEKYILIGTTGGPVNALILDVATHQFVSTPTSGPGVDWEVSNNGKYIVKQSISDHVYLDASTLNQTTVDTGGGWGGAWDSAGNIFYGLQQRPSGTVIRRFDAPTATAQTEVLFVDTAFPGGYVAEIQPTANPNKVFLYIYYGQNLGRVASYDLADSTIGFSYLISSQNTELTITPDWKTVIFTDPENFDNYLAERSVYMVDAANDRLETIIPPPPPPYEQGDFILNPKHVAVSPDGKFAMTDGPFEKRGIGMISMAERKYIMFHRPDTMFIWAGEPMCVACRAQP